MHLDTASFAPLPALAGGALVGLGAAILVLLARRIAGVSGIVGGLLAPRRGDLAWRVAFVLGLVLAPLLARAIAGDVQVRVDAAWPAIVAGGWLVGIGTRYGGGCTSGHGVCGLARLSLRSLVATAAFMLAGFATVAVVRHGIGA